MIMNCRRPFKHELFEKVSQHFPSLRKLTVVNTRSPRLFELHISYETLAIITNSFTTNSARHRCSQIRRLVKK